MADECLLAGGIDDDGWGSADGFRLFGRDVADGVRGLGRRPFLNAKTSRRLHK